MIEDEIKIGETYYAAVYDDGTLVAGHEGEFFFSKEKDFDTTHVEWLCELTNKSFNIVKICLKPID